MTVAINLDAPVTLPVGSPAESSNREQLSVAYLKMLAGVTGLTPGTWSRDLDCIDITLSSSVSYPNAVAGPKIDVQLKSTGQEKANRQDTIAWSLDSRSYEKMTKTNRSAPFLFCVLMTPGKFEECLSVNDVGLLAQSQMYWLWGTDFPPLKPGNESQTVHIPKLNLLTPHSLLELMEEASQWLPKI